MLRIVRVVSLALVAAVVSALGPAARAGLEPEAVATVSQRAYASTVVHLHGADYMILAGAEHVTKATGATRTTAYAKKTKCATLERKRIKLIACAAFVFPRKIPARAFDFDPLLDSARLRFHKPGQPTSLRWQGRGTPSPDGFPGADPSYGAYAYAEVSREARANGRIVGLPYSGKHFASFALLDEGTDAEAYDARGMKITRLPGGVLKVRAVYRIPR